MSRDMEEFGNGSYLYEMNQTNFDRGPVASLDNIIPVSVLFFLIGTVGIFGNALVICSVLSDRKMRTSVTNLLITNLAFADFFIMVFGVPEIVQFILNRGWLLGDSLCKFNRYMLVSSLYVSVLTLMAICVERFIGIIHPIEAHIVCNKRRVCLVAGSVWPVACLAGVPTLMFNRVIAVHPENAARFCLMKFPINHELYYLMFKYGEFSLFYFLPLCIQVALYSIITKHLFLGTEKLHRPVFARKENGGGMERSSDAVQARKGVVKMLIMSVVVYFLSYSPHQVMLFYNTISPRPFQETWSYHVFVMVIAYVNSAANPVLYSIFSQNFRSRFHSILCQCSWKGKKQRRRSTITSSGSRMWRLTSLRSATTEL